MASDEHFKNITVLPGGGKVSIWVSDASEKISKCLIIDLRKNELKGVIYSSFNVSPMAWSSTGRGAYAEWVSDGSSRRAVMRILDPRNWDVQKSFNLDVSVADLCWVSDSRLAIIGLSYSDIKPDGAPDVDWDVYYLNVDTGVVSRITRLGDAKGPIIRLDSNEIWCVRDRVDKSCVHSLGVDRVVWSTDSEHFLDKVTAISPNGKILVLHTHSSIFSVFADIIKYPKRFSRIWPVIPGRNAQATGASLIDPLNGRAVWYSLPGEVQAGAIGSGNKIALSVLLREGCYAVAEYNIHMDTEKILVECDRPLYVSHETLDGWIAMDDGRTVYLVTSGSMIPIFPLSEADVPDGAAKVKV